MVVGGGAIEVALYSVVASAAIQNGSIDRYSMMVCILDFVSFQRTEALGFF